MKITKLKGKEVLLMKRIIKIVCLLLSLFALTACRSNKGGNTVTTDTATIETGVRAETSGLKDGIYSAEMSKEYASSKYNGWQPQLTITVKNGEVESAVYDEVSGGQKKSQLSDSLNETNHPVGEWLPRLNESIKNASSPNDIEIIEGAENSSEEARKLYSAVLAAAQKGETKTVIVDL